MNKVAFFFFIVLCAIENQEAKFQLGFLSEISENANVERELFELRGRFDYSSVLTTTLTSEISVEALTQAGNISFNFFQRPGPRQGLRVRKAHVNIDPFKQAIVGSVGVFDPSELVRWPYFSPIAFPGARLSGHFGNDSFGGQWFVMQTVAASTVASRDVYENNQNPRLGLEGLRFFARQKAWEIDAEVFHYNFSALPAQVAHLSRFDGNTILGPNPQLADFTYGFDGIGTSLYGSFVLPAFKLGAMGSYLENSQAPSGVNKGFENSMIAEFTSLKNLVFNPSIGIFKKGSDFFPAYYLNNIQNMTNMQGQFARLMVYPRNRDWGVRMDYVEGEVIRQTLYQDNVSVIKVSWVQRYEVL